MVETGVPRSFRFLVLVKVSQYLPRFQVASELILVLSKADHSRHLST